MENKKNTGLRSKGEGQESARFWLDGALKQVGHTHTLASLSPPIRQRQPPTHLCRVIKLLERI
jgi:hypothetical protein